MQKKSILVAQLPPDDAADAGAAPLELVSTSAGDGGVAAVEEIDGGGAPGRFTTTVVNT